MAYYQHNHLMTPMQAVDKTGRVLWAGSYNPFGEASVITPNATQERPTINSNLRLPGQYLDDETGLHYNWNRYYEPEAGRYGQRDPIGFGGGFNTYTYVNGNPISYIDPTGEYAWIVIGAGLGGAYEGLKKLRDDPCASWTDVGLAALGGAVSGGIAAAAPVAAIGRGLGIGGAVAWGAAGGFGGSVLGQAIGNGGSVSVSSAAIAGAFGGIGGGLGNIGGLASALAKVRQGASSSAAISQGVGVGTGASYLYGMTGDALGLPPAGASDSCSCKR